MTEQNNSIMWFGREIQNPTPLMLKYLEEQKLPIVEGCKCGDDENYNNKYLSVRFEHRGCWRSDCPKCMEMIKNKQNYTKWTDLNPYWDENNCCCVDIDGKCRPLPIKFLNRIARAKKIDVNKLKTCMVHY